ncbi:MAG: ATP-binding protein [Coriobacteriia bacterium]|nr:ATP-binding protein [Coriobacteriia bacterium]
MLTLLSFGIENFRSFYSRQELELPNPEKSNITAIYGPNAGGKSNIAKAFMPFLHCITNSAEANYALPYEPFLLREGSDSEPTSFDVTFSHDDHIYTYLISYNHKRIIKEELKEKALGTRRSKTIFLRESDGSINPAASKYGFDKKLSEVTRKDTLLITKARENNNNYANLIFDLTRSLIISQGAMAGLHPHYTDLLKTDSELKKKVVNLLKKCDFSIRDLTVEETFIPDDVLVALQVPEEVRRQMIGPATSITTTHVVRDKDKKVIGTRQLDLAMQESAGTNELIGTITPIFKALEKGKTIFLDEFGAFMHTSLVNAIIDLFESEENKRGARLVFNTHNTSIMSRSGINREDIIFVEKNLAEESVITPFSSLSIRKDEAFEKRYRAGMYGGVPVLRMSDD